MPRQDPLEHRATPQPSLDQRIDALSRANEVRALRAQLKRDLKARRGPIGALLMNPPPYLETAKVFDIVLALPKVGSVKTLWPKRCIHNLRSMIVALSASGSPASRTETHAGARSVRHSRV